MTTGDSVLSRWLGALQARHGSDLTFAEIRRGLQALSSLYVERRGEGRRLRARLRGVVATAVSVGGNSERFPRAWLFHDRWGRNAEARTTRGERIRYATVGGRTTAWVPAVQGSGFRFPTTVARTRGRAGGTVDARRDVKA